MNWITPPRATASANFSNPPLANPPNSIIAAPTIVINPAAGPLTPKREPLNEPTMIPPTIPAINPGITIPAKSSIPSIPLYEVEAKEIPKQRGSATKNTTNPEARSNFKFLTEIDFSFIIQ